MHPRGPLVSLVAAAALIGCPQAHGADTIGEAWFESGGGGCSVSGTYIQAESPAGSYAAPYDGVITSWGSRGAWKPLTLKVARLGQAGSFTVIAADGPFSATSSHTVVTTYAVRIAVRQGDVIGGYTPSYVASQCGGGSGYVQGRVSEDALVGATAFFESTSSGQVPIEATIERDADGDGYGDDSQDQCPTNASTQAQCPLPTVLGQTFSPITSPSTRDTVVTASTVAKVAAQQDGVITSWSYRANSVVDGTVKLKMFRPLGGDDYRAVGAASAQTPVANSLNTYPTRISVRQGDKIGARTENLPIASNQDPAGSFAFFANDVSTGDSATFTQGSLRLHDISAVLEADADQDGYGDSSQDLCPADASTQSACPAANPPDPSACNVARAKLAKAKAKLKKLRKHDAAAKKIKRAKKKVKKAKGKVEAEC
jgi:hypothetical protein